MARPRKECTHPECVKRRDDLADALLRIQSLEAEVAYVRRAWKDALNELRIKSEAAR